MAAHLRAAPRARSPGPPGGRHRPGRRRRRPDGPRVRHRGQRPARPGAGRLRGDPDRRGRGRRAPSPSCSSSTAPAPWSTTTASTSWSSAIERADVPVDVWVGPSGSRATGDGRRAAGGRPHRRAWPRAAGWSSPRTLLGRPPPRRRGRRGRRPERRRGGRPRRRRQRAPPRSASSSSASTASRAEVVGHGRRPRAPAGHPGPLRPAAARSASCSTPWPARRWPTCCS